MLSLAQTHRGRPQTTSTRLYAGGAGTPPLLGSSPLCPLPFLGAQTLAGGHVPSEAEQRGRGSGRGGGGRSRPAPPLDSGRARTGTAGLRLRLIISPGRQRAGRPGRPQLSDSYGELGECVPAGWQGPRMAQVPVSHCRWQQLPGFPLPSSSWESIACPLCQHPRTCWAGCDKNRMRSTLLVGSQERGGPSGFQQLAQGCIPKRLLGRPD